jgi:hypothetical protein
MASAKQKAWRVKFGRMYGGGKKKSRRSTGGTMAKKSKKSGGFGGMGMNRVLTPKNSLFTIGGALVAPRLGMNAQIGAAAGGFAGAGLMGAAAGYFLGAPIANALGGITGQAGNASSGDLG